MYPVNIQPQEIQPLEQVHYHIASRDMYAINAFDLNLDSSRDYPTDEKIRAYMAFNNFRHFDPFLANLDRDERNVLEGINGEYRQIENEETTRWQSLQKAGAAASRVSGVVCGLSMFTGPAGMVNAYGVSMIGSFGASAFLNDAGDPYHNTEKDSGTIYTDPRRLERLQAKDLQIEDNINRIGVANNDIVRQERQAQNFFRKVVNDYHENNR